MRTAVIDGQGGGIGKSIVQRIRKNGSERFEVMALGTNSLATSGMIRAGGNVGATGENPIIVNADKVDVIMGPMAIVIPNSIMGEVTTRMAYAVGNSTALKILIPLNRCNVEIPGTSRKPIAEHIDDAVNELLKYCTAKKG